MKNFYFLCSLCDYCNYACEHSGHYNQNGICEVCGYACQHENGFNNNGICKIFNYECPHEELNDRNVCSKYNNPLEANIKNTSTNKNYIKLEDAITSLSNGDTLTICNNVKLKNSLSIIASCTIDLCGYTLGGYYIDLNSNITITDSKGNGYIAIASYSTSAHIELRGADTTNFVAMANKDRIKFYSGRINRLTISNGTIGDILPEGCIFVKHENSNSKKLTTQDASANAFNTDNCYLTVEVCSHDSVGEDLNCRYCGATLSQEQILKNLTKELQTTKTEMEQEIAKKENITTINEKVKNLNDTISSTETINKQYTDGENEQLRSELIDLINSAKLEAISSFNTAMELAKNDLQELINQKLDITTYNSKVEALTQAIDNAEIASKAYADSKDLALKNELQSKFDEAISQLQSKINESKTTLQNVSDEINERLNKAETNIDKNAKSINSLKTALIVVSVVFAILLSGSFTALYWMFIKKNKNSIKI